MATLTSGNQEGNFQLQITSEQNIEWRCLGTGDAWRRQFDLHVWPALLACLHGTGNRRAVAGNAFELRVGTSIELASCRPRFRRPRSSTEADAHSQLWDGETR